MSQRRIAVGGEKDTGASSKPLPVMANRPVLPPRGSQAVPGGHRSGTENPAPNGNSFDNGLSVLGMAAAARATEATASSVNDGMQGCDAKNGAPPTMAEPPNTKVGAPFKTPGRLATSSTAVNTPYHPHGNGADGHSDVAMVTPGYGNLPSYVSPAPHDAGTMTTPMPTNVKEADQSNGVMDSHALATGTPSTWNDQYSNRHDEQQDQNDAAVALSMLDTPDESGNSKEAFDALFKSFEDLVRDFQDGHSRYSDSALDMSVNIDMLHNELLASQGRMMDVVERMERMLCHRDGSSNESPIGNGDGGGNNSHRASDGDVIQPSRPMAIA